MEISIPIELFSSPLAEKIVPGQWEGGVSVQPYQKHKLQMYNTIMTKIDLKISYDKY